MQHRQQDLSAPAGGPSVDALRAAELRDARDAAVAAAERLLSSEAASASGPALSAAAGRGEASSRDAGTPAGAGEQGGAGGEEEEESVRRFSEQMPLPGQSAAQAAGPGGKAGAAAAARGAGEAKQKQPQLASPSAEGGSSSTTTSSPAWRTWLVRLAAQLARMLLPLLFMWVLGRFELGPFSKAGLARMSSIATAGAGGKPGESGPRGADL